MKTNYLLLSALITFSIQSVLSSQYTGGDGKGDNVNSGMLSLIEISLSDPCHCDNPQNIREASGSNSFAVSLFHDILTVMAPTGGMVTLDAIDTYFADAMGNEIMIGTDIPETSPGIYKLEFYRPPGTIFSISVLFDGGDETTFMSEESCPDDCPLIAIPAMGTWALLILSLSMLILAVTAMRHHQRQKALIPYWNKLL